MPDIPDGVTESEAIQHVNTFVSQTESLNEWKKNVFVELFQMYSLKDKRREIEPWLSNLQINGAFEFVERTFSALVSNTPSFELEETSPNAPVLELEPEVVDDEDLGGDGITVLRERLMVPFKEVYESQLGAMFKKVNMKRILREFTKGGLIYGTYGIEIRQEVVEREEYEAILEDESGQEVDINKIVEKIIPDVDLLEVFDIIVSPFARDPDNAIEVYGGFAVSRNDLSLRDLDENVYFNLDQLRESLSETGDSSAVDDKKEQKEQVVTQSGDDQGAPYTFNMTEMWTYFGEPGEEKKMIISVANGVLVRFEEVKGGEVPFVIWKDQEVPGQFWGLGEIEPIKPDLIEENTLKNQRIDFNNRALNEEWLVRSDAGIDVTQLVSKPHNIIVGDDIGPSAIREVVRNPATVASSGEDIDRLRRNMAAVNGSVDQFATGDIGGVTNTATGEKIRQQGAVARYAAKTENLEFAVAEIARKMLLIFAEGLSEGEKVPVFLRGKWREIDSQLFKEHLQKYIVRVRSGSMNIRNSITERNDRIAAVNIGLQAASAGLPINMEELYKPLLQSFKDVDVDKVLPPQGPDMESLADTQPQATSLADALSQATPAVTNELPNAENIERIT